LLPDLSWAAYQIVKGLARNEEAYSKLMDLPSHWEDLEASGDEELLDRLRGLSAGVWHFAGARDDLETVFEIMCRVGGF
jgi:hypothetical protein